MKKVWFLGLLAAAILAGCSDNDDNGGDEVKPGGGQVESPYLPQRIAQVKVVKDGERSDSVCYYYDTRGRVSFVDYGSRDYDPDNIKFSYFEDYSIESSDWVYSVLNGKVVAAYSSGWKEEHDRVRYEYDGNHLQLFQATRRNDILMMDFSFSGNNLNIVNLTYRNERDDEQSFRTVLKYGSCVNELNIDMFYFIMRHVFRDLMLEAFRVSESGCFYNDILESWLLGVAGERSACLPESMEVTMPRESGDGEETRAYTYKYTMKGEYVSEMAILDATGKEAYRFVFSYEE